LLLFLKKLHNQIFISGPQVSKESTPSVEVAVANPAKVETTSTEGAGKTEAEAVKSEAERSDPGCRIPCEVKAAVSIWLCLRCGSQACGGNVKDHSWAHFSQPR
jgi:hypothetical protein